MKPLMCAAMLAGLLPVWAALPARAAPPNVAAASAAPAVSVVTAAPREFTDAIVVTGTLVPRDELLITPQVEGLRIVAIAAEEGDRVEAGQLLATLDRAALEAQASGLAAQAQRAEAAIGQAKSQIVAAKATLTQTRAALTRARDLVRNQVTSQANLDDRDAAAATAEATLAAAGDAVKVAEAERVAMAAQIAENALKQSYAEIRAPQSGIIARRTARIGQTAAGMADPLFRIIARGEIELEADVPESALPRLAAGMTARIEAAGLPPRTATVRLVPTEVNATTRLGRARLFLGEAEGHRVGGYARARIEIGTSRGLAVPATAVLFQGTATSVQVVEDGVVHSRPVVLGLTSGGIAEIRQGLTAGDQVVSRSGTLLREGDRVRPVETDMEGLPPTPVVSEAAIPRLAR